MSAIEQSIGNGNSRRNTGERSMSLSEALEFLRSALHFVALADGVISVENDAEGVGISIAGVAFSEDESGDIYFQPVSPLSESIATPKDFELQDEVSSENEDEHGLV